MVRFVKDEATVGHLLSYQPGNVELVSEPGWEDASPRVVAIGSYCSDAVQQTLKGERGIVIVYDGCKIFLMNAGLFQTIICRARGEPPVVLDSRESLFFGSGDDFAVFDKCCCGIVIES